MLTEELDRQCGPFPSVREPIGTGTRSLRSRGSRQCPRPASPRRRWGHRTGHRRRPLGERLRRGRRHRRPCRVDAHDANEIFAGDRRLTEVTKAFCEQAPCQPSERFVATSPDGEEVEAWLVRPHDFEAASAIRCCSTSTAGPFTQYGNKFFERVPGVRAGGLRRRLLETRAARPGYSEEWGRAIRGPVGDGDGWGSLDYQDLMAVVGRRYRAVRLHRPRLPSASWAGRMAAT